MALDLITGKLDKIYCFFGPRFFILVVYRGCLGRKQTVAGIATGFNNRFKSTAALFREISQMV